MEVRDEEPEGLTAFRVRDPPQKTLVVGFIANGPINPTTVGLGWLCA